MQMIDLVIALLYEEITDECLRNHETMEIQLIIKDVYLTEVEKFQDGIDREEITHKTMFEMNNDMTVT